MKREFEYTVIENLGWLTSSNLKEWLNNMGNEGWELVCFHPVSKEYIFKREIIKQ